jgi:hypothetical protein
MITASIPNENRLADAGADAGAQKEEEEIWECLDELITQEPQRKKARCEKPEHEEAERLFDLFE